MRVARGTTRCHCSHRVNTYLSSKTSSVNIYSHKGWRLPSRARLSNRFLWVYQWKISTHFTIHLKYKYIRILSQWLTVNWAAKSIKKGTTKIYQTLTSDHCCLARKHLSAFFSGVAMVNIFLAGESVDKYLSFICLFWLDKMFNKLFIALVRNFITYQHFYIAHYKLTNTSLHCLDKYLTCLSCIVSYNVFFYWQPIIPAIFLKVYSRFQQL